MSGVRINISFSGWQGKRKHARVYEGKYIPSEHAAQLLGTTAQTLNKKVTPVSRKYRDTNASNFISLEQLDEYLHRIWFRAAADTAMAEIRDQVAKKRKAPGRKRKVEEEEEEVEEEEEEKQEEQVVEPRITRSKRQAAEPESAALRAAEDKTDAAIPAAPERGGNGDALPSWWSSFAEQHATYLRPSAVPDMMQSQFFKDFCMERIKDEVDEELAKKSDTIIDSLKPTARAELRAELQETVLKEVERRRTEMRNKAFSLDDFTGPNKGK